MAFTDNFATSGRLFGMQNFGQHKHTGSLYVALVILSTLGGCLRYQPAENLLDAATKTRAVGILREGLRSDEFWPSIHAAEALSLIGYGDEVIASLAPRLNRVTDDRQRCGIARELVRAGDSTYIEVLAAILKGTDPYAHTHAAESLYKLGLVGDASAMRQAYASDDTTRHLMAAGALARSGDEEALQSIRNAYDTGEPGAMQISAWLLGRIGDESDIPRLKNRLDEAPEGLIFAYIQHSLAALGDPDGLQALTDNLTSDDPAIRTYAATFAGESGRLELIPHLIPLLDDPHPDASYRAAQSLLLLSL